MKGEGKEEKKKKAMVAPLVFIIATSEIFGRKLFDAKGPFGDNVIKNPASTHESLIHTIVTVQLVNFCTLHKSSCRE